MPRLTPAEIDAFLAEDGHLLRIATVDANGMPRIAPTWFIYRHGALLFTPRGTSLFLANLRRDSRVGLSIDEESLPYRKLTVQGVALVLHDPGRDAEWRDLYQSIACRYISTQAAAAYIHNTIDQPRALITVALAESNVTTWRMPVAGEAQSGIWARRYYLPGTEMDQRAARASRNE